MKTGSTVKRQSTGKEDPVYKMGKNKKKMNGLSRTCGNSSKVRGLCFRM